MSRVDHILAVIDTGLQIAGDDSYEDEVEGMCWRCLTAPTAHPDETCTACRFDLAGQLAAEPFGPTLDYIGPIHGPAVTGGVLLDRWAADMAWWVLNSRSRSRQDRELRARWHDWAVFTWADAWHPTCWLDDPTRDEP